jgi:flagellar hook assembly protein FlgD
MVTNVDDNTLEKVSSFELFQNYPNPFNPVTHIAYNVVKSTHVRITIYNQLGRHIKTLVNSRHSAGHYSVSWDAKDKYDLPIAAGLYFCKMEADDFIKMIKLALVK